MNSTRDLTKGSSFKAIIAFAIPLFFSNLFQQLYNSIDSLIVGNMLGTNALAAVSSSGNIMFFFNSFFIGTSMGAGVLVSKTFGAKDYNAMKKAIHTNIALGIIMGIALTLIGYFGAPVILRIMKTDPLVLPQSIMYFKCYFLGALGFVMYNIFNGILNALGNSKRSLVYLIISSTLNIFLDLLFVGVFKFGVGSAAIATAISQLTSAILAFLFLIRKGTFYQVKISEIKIDRFNLLLILKYGLPSGIQNSVISLSNMFIQSNINTFGNNAMAGCGTYSKVEGFAFLPVNCFTMALSTFVSQNLGAKEYERAKKGSRFGILAGVILAEFVGALMFLFMPYIAKLFSDDPEVIRFASLQAKVDCLFYFLMAFSHCVAAILRGAGKAFVPMIIMLSVWCVFRVIYVYFALKMNPNIETLFTAYPVTWTISSLIYFIYYNFTKWEYSFEKKYNKSA